MSKKEENLISIEIILDDNGNYKKLMPTQLKHIPAKGDYYSSFIDKKIYEITSVIHEDLHIILLVTETDEKLYKIISLVYNQV